MPFSSINLFLLFSISLAVEFLRVVKSKQLECFDELVCGELPKVDNCPFHDILFDPKTGQAVGYSLINVSPQHPMCLHTLMRLTQKDVVNMGHRRTSTGIHLRR